MLDTSRPSPVRRRLPGSDKTRSWSAVSYMARGPDDQTSVPKDLSRPRQDVAVLDGVVLVSALAYHEHILDRI
jgi:hypothetical protein